MASMVTAGALDVRLSINHHQDWAIPVGAYDNTSHQPSATFPSTMNEVEK